VQTRLLDAELVAMHRQAPRDGELLDLAWSARR
jgi:hypothetical protein